MNNEMFLNELAYLTNLGLSSKADVKTFKRWRESELKHGRLAMIAAVAIIFPKNGTRLITES